MVAVTPVASSLPCPSSLPLRQLRIGIAALAWLAIFTGTARAQAIWVGTVSNAWSAPGNWSPELVPFPGESIVVADITPGDRINLDVPATIGSFQLGSDGSRVAPLLNVYTGDRTFTIDGGLTAAGELDRVALRIRGNTTLGLDQVWDVGGEMGSVTIDRGVFVQNDGGNNLIQLTGSLTKTGSGQLSLGGVTVDGPGDIVVDAGALKLNAGFSRLLTVGGSGRIVVNDGAGLFISKNSGTMDVTRQIVMNGTAELIAGGGGFNLGTPNTIASPIEWNGTHRLGMINDNPTTFSGAWTGSGSISRSGGETITLSGDASGFTGTLSIADGTTNLDGSFSAGTVAVRGGSVTLGSATFGAALDVAGGTVTVGDLEVPLRSLSGSGGQVVGGSGSRLVVDQTADTSFAGSLGGSGSLALTKRGGGDLRLAAALGSGITDVTLEAGGLGLSGTVASYAQTGGSLLLGLGPDPSSPLGQSLVTSGDASFTAGAPIELEALGGSLASGTYRLVTAGGSLIGGAGVSVAYGSPTRSTFTPLVNEAAGTIDVQVDAVTADLVWAGTGSVWDVAGAASFTNPSTGNPDQFYDLDRVTFDDSAGGADPSISGLVAPGSVAFTASSRDYVLGGSGSLAGGGSLAKSGAASLTILSANSFTGGTTLAGGRLRLGSDQALGSGPLVVSGGSLSTVGATDREVAGGLSLSGDLSVGDLVDSGTIRFAGGGTLSGSPTITTVADLIVAGPLAGAGTGLTKAGAGSLILESDAAYDGPTTVAVGTLGLGAGGAGGGLAGDLAVAAGATARWLRSDSAAVAHAISGAGSLEFAGTGIAGESRYQLAGDNTGLTGSLAVADARVDLAGPAAAGAATITVASGGQLGIEAAGSYANPLAIAGDGWLTGIGGREGALTLGGDAELTGGLTLAGDARLAVSGAATIASSLGDGGAGRTLEIIALSGSGSLTLADQTSLGGLVISPVPVNALGVVVPASGTLSIGAGGLRLGNVAPFGNASPTLEVAGTATNAGPLTIGRPGRLTIQEGGQWTQGDGLVVGGQGGFNAWLEVLAGGTFTYTGTAAVQLNGSEGYGGKAYLDIDGGRFVTPVGFEQVTTTNGFGRLTLSNGGTLELSAAVPELTGSGVEFVVGDGGGTIDTAGHDATLTAAIAGGGGLTKAGGGTLTLDSPTAAEGPLTVTGGTLALGFGASFPTTAEVTLAGGGISQAGGLSLFFGQTIALDGPGGTGSGAVVGNFSLVGGTLAFDVVSPAAHDQLTIADGGSLDISFGDVVINAADGTLGTGTYDLISYAGAITGSPDFLTLSGVPTSDSRQSVSLADSGSAIQLVVAGAAADLVWTGAVDNAWNVGSFGTANWQATTPIADPDRFFQGDSVSFTGQAPGIVAVDATVQPGRLTVAADVDYTLAGFGTITTAVLEKSGTGTLAIETLLTVSERAAVSGGTLRIAAVDTLGTAPLSLDGGTVDLTASSGDFATPLSTGGGGGRLALSGAASEVIITTAADLGGDLELEIADADAVVRSRGGFSGSGGLVKTGAGRVVLDAASSYSGETTIVAGTVVARNDAAFGDAAAGTTVADGATLKLGGDLGNNALDLGDELITVSGTGIDGTGVLAHDGPSQQQNAVSRVVLAADAAFGGTRRFDIRGSADQPGLLDLAGHTLTKLGTNTIYAVDGTVTGGDVLISSGTLGFARAVVEGPGTVTVETDATLAIGYGTAETAVGSNFAKGIVLAGGRLLVPGGVNAADATVRLDAASGEIRVDGAETSLSLGGGISEQGLSAALVKTGSGRLVLGGPGTFTGGTAVNGGILEVAEATALGSGPVSIANTGAANTTHSLRPANVSLGNDIEISYRYTEDFAGAITAVGGGRSTLTGGVTGRPSEGTGTRGGHLASLGEGSVLRLEGSLDVAGGLGTIIQRTGVVEYGGGGSSAFTLDVTGTARLAAADGIPTTASVLLGGSGPGGTLDMNGFNQTLAGLSRDNNPGLVTNGGAGPAVLTIDNAVNSVYTGGIEDGSGGLSLVKTGSGSFTLGAATSFTGPTSVEQGSLILDAAAALAGSGRVSVAAFATVDVTALPGGYLVPAAQTVGGEGTLLGSVTLESGATLAPGASPGSLGVSQDVIFGPGGNYNWQIAAATGTAGLADGWDLLTVGGGITVTATSESPFDLNLWTLSGTGPDVSGPLADFDPASGYSWTIARSSAGISGFAADLFRVNTGPANGTAGFANPFGGGSFAVAQVGNDLELVYTPGSTPTDIVIDVAAGTETQAEAGYPTIASATSVRKTGGGTLVFDAANAYTGPTTVSAGTLEVANPGGLANTNVTVDTAATLAVAAGTTLSSPSVIVDGGTLSAATLAVSGSGGIASLAINAGTLAGSPAVTVADGGLLSLVQDARVSVAVGSLEVAESGGGRVDLGSGQIEIAAGGTTPEQLRADIIAGRNGGAWNGTAGITSAAAAAAGGSRAVGYLVSGDGSARVSFAAPGDTDLNGQVNVFDLIGIDSAGKFGNGQAAVWSQGDFNYDGVANVFDLIGIDSSGAYGSGPYFPASPTAAGGLTGSVAAVPEPGGWLLAASGLVALAVARRRQASAARGWEN